MHKGKTYLAIIPARGGSKRLPRKNLLKLAGKPLIAWSIQAALENSYIDDVIVSSDDDEILSVSQVFGANILKRPVNLATDNASTFDVVENVLSAIQKTYDYIVLLQPTSPLRTSNHINEAITLLDAKNADAVVSVCEMEHSPLWSNTLSENGNMDNFLRKEILDIRSQDLEKYYRLNGAIYICKTDKLLKRKDFFLNENIYAYKMQREVSIDIDHEIDFKLAEFFINNA